MPLSSCAVDIADGVGDYCVPTMCAPTVSGIGVGFVSGAAVVEGQVLLDFFTFPFPLNGFKMTQPSMCDCTVLITKHLLI